MKIVANELLTGQSTCYRVETEARIFFIVSPAVLVLLEDEDVSDIVMKDLQV